MAAQAIERSDSALKDNGALVETLWHAVDEGAGTLEAVPALVRKVLETGAWQRRAYRGRVFEHERFLDFITARPLAGCGWPPEKVEALIRDDAETLAMWRVATTGKQGAHHDNIMMRAKQGTSRAYTLAKLSVRSPALHAAVVAGELSANAAAIQAGFRKKPTPFEQVAKLIPKLSAAEKRQLWEMLQ